MDKIGKTSTGGYLDFYTDLVDTYNNFVIECLCMWGGGVENYL